MRGSPVPGEKHIQGNPLELHLRVFAAALKEAGYRERTMCSKLRLLADLGLWLKRNGLIATSHLEEHLLAAFFKHKQRIQQMGIGWLAPGCKRNVTNCAVEHHISAQEKLCQ